MGQPWSLRRVSSTLVNLCCQELRHLWKQNVVLKLLWAICKLSKFNKTLLCSASLSSTHRKEQDVVKLTVIRTLIFIPGTHVVILQKEEENTTLPSAAKTTESGNSQWVHSVADIIKYSMNTATLHITVEKWCSLHYHWTLIIMCTLEW